MNICINVSSPEFKRLLEDTGLSETVLAAKISIWRNNNDSTKFPTSNDLKDISKVSVSGFVGYKGGFYDEGKGTPEGDGKDKAMRDIAYSGFIGELNATSKKGSSTLTSFERATSVGSLAMTNLKDVSGLEQVHIFSLSNEQGTIMLARNGVFRGKPLLEQTKKQISEMSELGYSFVVGDMPDVDSQFIEYLVEIDANFMVFHTGDKSRINVEEIVESKKLTVKEETASFYEGDIKPEPNTIFVFGSNPEGRHGAGSAKVAREKFGAKYGQGEGLQGNAYALPTKNIRKTVVPKGTINVYWGQPESPTSTRILSNLAPRKFIYESVDGVEREYGSVEHAYQTNKNGRFDQVTYNKYVNKGGYGAKIAPKLTERGKRGNLQLMKDLVVESFIQNPNSEAANKLLQYENFTHNTNELIDQAFLEGLKLAQKELTTTGAKSISPERIIESIKKLYETARQNPDKQFKVAYRNTTEASLNGYTGLEMIEMFNQAGVIPSNIVFSKEWADTGKLKTEQEEETPDEPVYTEDSREIEEVSNPEDISFNPERNLDGKTTEETRAYIERFVFHFNRKLLVRAYKSDAGLSYVKHFLSDQSTLESIYNEIVLEIQQNYKDIAEKNPDSELATFIAIDENYKKLVSLSKDYFKNFISFFDAEAEIEQVGVDSKDSAGGGLWQAEQVKINPKTRASSFIKYILSTLPSAEENNLFRGVPRSFDFGTMYSILSNRLSQAETIEEMMSTLESLSSEYDKKDKNVKAAIDGLISTLFYSKRILPSGQKSTTLFSAETIQSFSDGHLRMIMEFFSNFNKNFNNYYIVKFGENGSVTYINSSEAAQKQRIKLEAKSWFSRNKQNFFNRSGSFIEFDVDEMKLMGWVFDGDLLNANNNMYIDEFKEETNTYIRNYRVASAFLSNFGFRMPENVDEMSTDDMSRVFSATNNIFKSINDGTEKNFFSPKSNSEGYINTILAHIVKYDKSQYENSHVRSDGSRIYNVSLHSTMSRIVNAINRSTSLNDLKSREPQLFTIYTAGSQLLRPGGMYFNEDGTRRPGSTISLSFLDEIGPDGTGKNSQTFDVAPIVDQMMGNFNSIHINSFAMPRAGDNQIERHLKLNSKLSFGTELNIDYLIDEINHILELHSLADDDGVYYKGVPYDDIDALITKYPVIDMIISSDIENLSKQQASFKAFITDVILNRREDYINDLYNRIPDINLIFDAYISIMAEKTFDSMVNEGAIIKTDEEDYYSYNIFYQGSKTDSDILSPIAIRSVFIESIKENLRNYSYARIEQTKLFTGPLVYYENNDKFYQRMAGLAGTKTIGADSPTANRVLEQLNKKPLRPSYWQKELYGEGNVPDVKRLYQSLNQDGEIEISSDPNGNSVFRILISDDPNGVSYRLKQIKSILKNDDIGAYDSMDIADGFAFAPLRAYKALFEASSMWNTSLERLYQWYMRPEKSKGMSFFNPDTGEVEQIKSQDEIRNPDGSLTVFTVAKPQHFGSIIEQGFPPGMHKLSVMPILPEYIEKYPAFRSIQKELDLNNAGMFTFPTANKTGTRSDENGMVPSTYKPISGKVKKGGKATVDISDAIVQDTFSKNWGIQLSTGTSVKGKNTTGTQLSKLIYFNVYENGVVKEGKEEVASKAEEVGLITKALIINELEKLIDRYGIKLTKDDFGERYEVVNPNELMDFLISEVEKRDVPKSAVESLEILKDNWTRLKSLRLDILENRAKLENILASIVDSRIISRKTNGSPKVQASSVFFEKEDGDIVYANDEAQIISKNLKFYEDDGVMEVMMPHWFKESLLNKMDFEDIKETELLEYIKENSPELLDVIGFRIPTSGLNSIEAIRIVGFLPQSAGETIVVPAEIVAKAGSDFDVDKLNLFFANYRMNKKTGKPEYIKYVSLYKDDGQKKTTLEFLKEIKETNNIKDEDFIEKNKDIDDDVELLRLNSNKALENGRLKNIHYIVSHPSNRKDLLESIGINLIKEQEERIIKEKDEYTARSVVFDFSYNTRITNRNIDSKKLTGVSALHLVDHMHAMRYGYKVVVPDEFVDIFPNANYETVTEKDQDGVDVEVTYLLLGRQDNSEGVKISTILNQMVNAAVDGVKDPVFYNLNLNLETSGFAFLLIRGGVPLSDVFDFLTNPAIKRFSQISMNSKSSSTMLSINRKDIPKRVISELNESGLDRETVERYTGFLKLYSGFTSRDGKASALTQYMQATRLDTQAMGKNTTQLEIILRAAEIVAQGESGIVNAEKIFEKDGFLEGHFNALQVIRGAYSELFFISSDNQENVAFSSAYQIMLDYAINEKNFLSVEDKTKILDSFKNYALNYISLTAPKIKIGEYSTELPIYQNDSLYSRYDTDTSGVKYEKDGNVLRAKVKTNTTVAIRVETAKKYIKNNKFLNFIRGHVGSQIYQKHISPGESKSRYVDTIYPVDQRFESIEITEMQDSFEELFSNPWILKNDPNLPYEIIQLIFLQGGIQPSPLSMVKFIPPKYYMQAVASAYKSFHNGETSSTAYNSTTSLIGNFFISSYNNSNMIDVYDAFSEATGKPPNSLLYKKSRRTELTDEEMKELEERSKSIFDPVPSIFINTNYLEKAKSLSQVDKIFSQFRSGNNEKDSIEVMTNTIIHFAESTFIWVPTPTFIQSVKKSESPTYTLKQARQRLSWSNSVLKSLLKKKRLTSKESAKLAIAKRTNAKAKRSLKALDGKSTKRNITESIENNKKCRGK